MTNHLTSLRHTFANTFNISGTASRREYITYFVAALIVNVISTFIDYLIEGEWVGTAAGLALFITGTTVQIRRMHDIDRVGWWILVPIYGFYLLFTKSRPNRWSVSTSQALA